MRLLKRSETVRNRDEAPTVAGDGEYLWDLRGNGHLSIMVAGAAGGLRCDMDDAQAYGIEDGNWYGEPTPPAPEAAIDIDGDRVPDFPFEVARARMMDCPYMACGKHLAFGPAVLGYVSWDGTSYAQERPSYRAVYERLLADARAEGSVSAQAERGRCPVETLEHAARTFVYAQLLGATPDAARAEADAMMRPLNLVSCPETILGSDGPSRRIQSWPEARTQLQLDLDRVFPKESREKMR